MAQTTTEQIKQPEKTKHNKEQITENTQTQNKEEARTN